jgi:hypothetical protein
MAVKNFMRNSQVLHREATGALAGAFELLDHVKIDMVATCNVICGLALLEPRPNFLQLLRSKLDWPPRRSCDQRNEGDQ